MKLFTFYLFMGGLAVVLASCNSSTSDVVSDNFDQGKEQWIAWYDPAYPTTHCESMVDAKFGLPAPSLFLNNRSGQCSGADILNGMIFSDGTVELDVYLETDALIDVVFRGDLEKNTGYIARLDSRDYHDTFIKMDNWKMLGGNNGHTTSPHQWHHMRVDVEGTCFTLFCDGQEVARTEDTEFTSGNVALMNEVNNVYVDNITVLSKKNGQTVADHPLYKAGGNHLTIVSVLVLGMCIACAILSIGIFIGYSIRKK